jgi:hypothetical protein
MPEFCSGSFKQNVFLLPSTIHDKKQIALIVVMFLELFLAVMSSVRTEVAPTLSLIIALYTTLSIYSYFGLPTNKIVDVSQSYFAATKLSAFFLGYLFDSICSGSFKNEVYFTLLTILVTLDASQGFHYLVSKQQLSVNY